MAHPTPILGGTPGFFHQNDHKGCKRDVPSAKRCLLNPSPNSSPTSKLQVPPNWGGEGIVPLFALYLMILWVGITVANGCLYPQGGV